MPGLTLILVDDSDVDRYIARRVFTHVDDTLEVLELADGRDAISYLEENEIPAGHLLLMLLDINMPIVNGFEFLQAFSELRHRRPDFRRCMINVMTSSNHPEDIERTASYPFVNRHVVKMPSEQEARAILRDARRQMETLQPA